MRLKDIGTIVTGNTPSKKNNEYYESNDILFIRPSDIEENYITLLEDSEEYISEKAREKARILPEGAVLVTCIGTIGKVGILKKEATCNQQINAIIPNDKVISKYLAYLMQSKQKLLQLKANAPVVPIINKTDFSEMEINICDIDEQKKIVEQLDLLKTIIDKRKKQIEELQNILKSQFVEMFGDPVSNNLNWNILKMSELGTLERGTSKHRPRNAPELLGGIYPLIQTGDVSNSGLYITDYKSTYSELGLKQSKMWRKDTLCITIAANIAQTSILTFDACFPDSVVGFITNALVNNIFIHYWFGFLQKNIDAQATQVAQKNINLKVLNNLDVIVPPIELQNQFADIVKQIDKQKFEIEKSLKEMQELYESLMEKYFG
mgnify:CR=1 FL=1